MKPNFTLWLSVLTLFMVLSACEDHRIPQEQRFRIKKVITTDTETLYFYSGNGRFASRATHSLTDGSPTPAPFSAFIFTYDGQERVTKATSNYDLQEYYFDADGKLRSVYSYVINSIDPYSKSQTREVRLDYDQTNILVRTTAINGRLNTERLYTYTDYTYSAGNVVQTKTRMTYNTGYDLPNAHPVQTFQYDGKPNPFYGLIYGDFSDPDFQTLSKNNIVESNAIYTYDGNGLLIKKAQRDGSSATTYEYETY